MKNIDKVLICGIGAVGSIYADKISAYNFENLKVLVDKERFTRYVNTPKIFNGKELKLNYILPEATDYKADLIIIATKYSGLNDVVKNIANFVKEDTIILSLLNGITSEEIISSVYGSRHVPLAYFIGHSAMRSSNIITHDGVGEIVFGIRNKEINDENDIELLKEFFDKVNISYRVPEDMPRALWLKYLLNAASNQSSAILRMTFGQMQRNKRYREFIEKVMLEVVAIAKAEGVNNTETLIEEAMVSFDKMIPEGKTSMLQDVEAGRKTELEMFGTTIVELGKKHNLPTPYNKVMKEMLNIIEYKE